MRVGRDESGVGSILVISLSGVVMMLGLAGAYLAATAAAHRQAQGAADLAALAGAGAMQQGAEACQAARANAADNRAQVLTCAVIDQDVLITVTVQSPRWLGHSFEVNGRARAGPEEVT